MRRKQQCAASWRVGACQPRLRPAGPPPHVGGLEGPLGAGAERAPLERLAQRPCKMPRWVGGGEGRCGLPVRAPLRLTAQSPTSAARPAGRFIPPSHTHTLPPTQVAVLHDHHHQRLLPRQAQLLQLEHVAHAAAWWEGGWVGRAGCVRWVEPGPAFVRRSPVQAASGASQPPGQPVPSSSHSDSPAPSQAAHSAA